MAFTCGYCRQTHQTTEEARICAAFERRANAQTRVTPYQELSPTENQVRYIEDLAKKKGVTDPKLIAVNNRPAASRMIRYLKGLPDVSTTAPTPPSFTLDFAVVNMIKSGRYAVKASDDHAWMFFRVLRPVTGKKKGMLKVDSMHSESWYPRLLFSADGKLIFHRSGTINGTSLAEALALVVINQVEASYNYAQKLGSCGICGITLTDDRSRWFHVGPDCEKKMLGAQIVNYVIETKGDFVPATA